MRRTSIVALGIAFAMAATSMAPPLQQPARAEATADPWAADPAVTARVGDGHADATGAPVEMSQFRFTALSARHVVLARVDKFPDALAGSPLSAEGPMLLTPPDRLTDAVRTEIDRVLPEGGTVYLLGGPNALAPAIASEIEAMGRTPRRLFGPDRVQTAAAIAAEVAALYPDGASHVVLARAFGPEADTDGTAAWADAIGAGAWATSRRHPILLTMTDVLSEPARNFLKGRDAVTVVGGPNAISVATFNEAKAVATTVERVHGSDRAFTAQQLLVRRWGIKPGVGRRTVVPGYAASGWTYALAATGLAADHAAPMLLVDRGVLPAGTIAGATNCGDKSIQVLAIGGTDLISDTVLAALEAEDGQECGTSEPPPEGGRDRTRITVVHVVPEGVEVPADRVDAIRQEVGEVDAWFAQQSGWQGLRFETLEGAFVIERLDANEEVANLGTLRRLLDDAGHNDLTLAYVEGEGRGECGSSDNATIAALWMPACNIYPDVRATFPYGGTYLAAHELAHLLGAVPACGPNYVKGHVSDSKADLLYRGEGERDWTNLQLDVGRDDYFGHGRRDCTDIGDHPLWVK